MKTLKMPIMVLFVVGLMAAAGCSAVGNALNPYKSEFQCPLTDKGKCVDLPTAYNESLALERSPTIPNNDPSAGNAKNISTAKLSGTGVSAETQYQESLYRKLADMLSDPVTPVVAPPKVMRVLLLPYKGDKNSLYMFRYAYFFVDEPKWVLGNYLNTDSGEE